MIKHLTSSAIFPKSGATLTADYQPQSGITAVVGENGSGKTFKSIETIRWLLYGKAALRGAAADYKDATAGGTLTIRGADYEVHRGKGGELVMECVSGDIVARGAEKVTEYMTQVMGYPLEVFDLCNAATQGNVQKLGELRPAERKAIIDKVLKLTDAEKAEKDCREEAKGYKRDVDALTKALVAPGDAPVIPQGYEQSAAMRSRLNRLRDDMETADRLRAQLRQLVEPVPPTGSRPRTGDIADMEAHESARMTQDTENRRLNSIVHRCMPYDATEYTEDQLVAAEKRNATRHAIEQRGPAPQLTGEQSEHNWASWAVYDAYRPSDTIECPKCHNRFCPTGAPPPQPAWTKTALREDDARRAKHAAAPLVMPDGLDLTEKQISHARSDAAAKVERDAAVKALAALGKQMVDKSAELAAARRLFHHFEAYDQQLAAYTAAKAANEAVQKQLDAIGHLPTASSLAPLYDLLSIAERYEADCRAYDDRKVAFDALTLKITDAQHLADEYAAGAKDVAAARAVVKALIAPKISRIATGLIRDMSLGKLTDLVLDDEMEITVGGQRIETLSGAGKTVANLALRVAMGQALVGHVFPVFLADEIDGDLSASRREATLQALVSLKKHMDQIILVTHRGADIADQVWDVENTV